MQFFDLFLALKATDKQLDFPYLFAIAREGIVPQVDGGMSFDAAPLGVYWTSAAGVPFWYGHALEHAGDVPPARRRQSVPVVLRARRPRGLRRDEAGTEDAGADAWYGPEAVSPEAVEAWDGQAWRPVTAWRELPLDLGLRDVLGEDEFLPVEQSPLVPPAGR